MNETRRLRAILLATVLAATPAAAQASAANPFGLPQGSTTELARPHRHYAWRMERGMRMGWRGERVARHRRWHRSREDRLHGRAWARRGARWEHRGRRPEAREYRRHRFGERWRQAHGLRHEPWRAQRRWWGERSPTHGDASRGDHPRGAAPPGRHREDTSGAGGTL
ncbi:MAG: hypothetical protein ACTHM9_02475 [Gemmatimonadales bacterium]